MIKFKENPQQPGESLFLERRRGIVGLSLIAIGSMSLITLYQTGVLQHLPGLPLPILDADKVDAYARFSTPNAIRATGSYTMTAELAAMGGQHRTREQTR